MKSCFLGLGSNQGDRHANINRAASLLKQAIPHTKWTHSSIIETPALLKEDAPQSWNIPFLNSVLHFETSLHFSDILHIIQTTEQTIGKNFEAPVWSPRIIDIDILLFDDTIHNAFNLTIPHGQMHKRLFVLEPICEIAPETFHPVLKKTCEELLTILKNTL